ncbi:recombinase family protein [Carboxylicivirga sp. RSCT41]|uniref:recombinase family protein n=1 Tax=Carboxylicivirga agarovorans TaxID=3417570 RepID=UPI003D33BE96
MKTIAYIRTSTTNKQDLLRQVEPIKNFCERKGLLLDDNLIFSDEISGNVLTHERTGYKKLLKFVNDYKGNNLHVVFDEVSRLGRRQDDIHNNITFYTERSNPINIHFVNPECSYFDDNGNVDEGATMIISLYAQFAAAERRKIQHRVNTSISRSAAKNKHLGGKFVPYGYKVVDSFYQVDESESLIVNEVFDLYISGLGQLNIAKHLNRKGKKARLGGEFIPNVIMQMIKNPQYKGVRVVRGEEYSIPAIVDSKKWEKANDLRKSKNRVGKRVVKNTNPLVSKLKCRCGSVIIVYPRGGKLSYGCHRRIQQGKKACNYLLTVDYNILNNAILTYFELNAKKNTDIEDRINVLSVEKKNIEDILIPNTNNDLNDIDEQLDRAAKLFIKKRLTEKKYDE